MNVIEHIALLANLLDVATVDYVTTNKKKIKQKLTTLKNKDELKTDSYTKDVSPALIQELLSQLDLKIAAINSIVPDSQKIEELESRVSELNDEVKSLRSSITNSEKTNATLLKDKEALESKISEQQKTIDSFETKFDELNTSINSIQIPEPIDNADLINEVKALVENLPSNEDKFDELNKIISELPTVESVINAASDNAVLSEVKDKIVKLHTAIEAMAGKGSTLEKLAEVTEQQIIVSDNLDKSSAELLKRETVAREAIGQIEAAVIDVKGQVTSISTRIADQANKEFGKVIQETNNKIVFGFDSLKSTFNTQASDVLTQLSGKAAANASKYESLIQEMNDAYRVVGNFAQSINELQTALNHIPELQTIITDRMGDIGTVMEKFEEYIQEWLDTLETPEARAKAKAGLTNKNRTRKKGGTGSNEST